MNIRPARMEELDTIMALYDQGRRFMRRSGNANQWINGYPSREMIREAKSCNVPLEMNLLGIREDRHYPNSDFWEIVAEENAPVIIGADAHTPEVFQNALAEEKAFFAADHSPVAP